MASVTFFSAFTRPSIIHQTLPGKPKFTEKDIKDLSGKVYIVTGSNTGVGKELARILYGANAAVYMACRTESKARDAIKDIQSAAPESKGRLEFLQLDLSDLKTIQPAAEAFTSKESKLHVLFNNAGVMVPPPDKKTAQGYDMQLGTNCLGPVLFTNLVTGTLKATAQQEPPGTVRVVWVSSSAAEIYSGKNGLNMDEVRNKETYGQGSAPMDLYGNSKAGNYFHSVEYARRHKDDGIVSVALNPGNLDSDLYRSVKDQSGVTKWVLSILKGYMVYPQVNGAYTELWAGLSEEVTLEKSGSWIGPWGKFYDIRHDLADAGKPIDQGGQGVATAFWDWSVQQTKAFQGQSAHL